MHDLFVKMINLDDYAFWVVICMIFTAFWLLRSITKSTFLSLVYTPALAIGALAANYLYRINYIELSSNRDANVVVASAIGVILALMIMLVATRIAIFMHDRKDREHQPLLLPRDHNRA